VTNNQITVTKGERTSIRSLVQFGNWCLYPGYYFFVWNLGFNHWSLAQVRLNELLHIRRYRGLYSERHIFNGMVKFNPESVQ